MAARYRPISPEQCWRSSRSAALTISERQGEFYLLTSPFSFANPLGCYSIVPRISAAEMGISVDELDNILDRLHAKGIASRVDSYIVVRTWFLHNTWESTFQGNVAKAALKAAAGFPRTVLDEWAQASLAAGVPTNVLQQFLESLGSPLQGASKGLADNNNNHNPDSNKTKTTPTLTERGGGALQFEKSVAHLVEDLSEWVAPLDRKTAQLVVDELADAFERANLGKREPIGRPSVWVAKLVKSALDGTFQPDGARRIQRRRAREVAHAEAIAAASVLRGAETEGKATMGVAAAELRKAKSLLKREGGEKCVGAST